MNPSEHLPDLEKKTGYVVILTAVTMVVEIIFGLLTNSMALLADGIHMGSHVFAIGLSWLAYVIIRHLPEHYTFPRVKILSLSGYSSGLLLMIFAVVIMIEAIERFYHPAEIVYREAILVALIGLSVNVISAFLLQHDREHSDHNIRAAYLHVLADALTSISAILGLTVAMIFDFPLIDSLAAILSSLVIIRWSIGLLMESGKVLLGMSDNRQIDG
jgi:cation diffusion facilitator family transporter